MIKSKVTYRLLLTAIVMIASSVKAYSQGYATSAAKDTIGSIEVIDTIDAEQIVGKVKTPKPKRDWKTWRPDVKRALWLSIVIPGGGQIYNRKYWKLPLIYGGFVGCAYAINWNNQMYHDYAQAYLDIVDNDPNTESYNSFLHLGATVTDSNKARYQEIFRKRKDRYRRYRDLSVAATLAVYALSVIDAYVDASLSEFDITDDLSLRVTPALINTNTSTNPVKSTAVGLGCSLSF